MKERNEKGIVFLDDINRPYLLRKWGCEGEEWLFYWHGDVLEGHWVSLRKVEIGNVFPDNLTQAEQDLYHAQHDKWNKGL